MDSPEGRPGASALIVIGTVNGRADRNETVCTPDPADPHDPGVATSHASRSVPSYVIRNRGDAAIARPAAEPSMPASTRHSAPTPTSRPVDMT